MEWVRGVRHLNSFPTPALSYMYLSFSPSPLRVHGAACESILVYYFLTTKMEAPWGQEPPGFCSLLTPTCLVLWDWDPSKPWRHFRRYSEGKETRTEEGNVSVEGNATPVTFKLCPLDHQQQEKLGASYRCEFSGLAPGLTNRKALSWGSAGLKCLVM